MKTITEIQKPALDLSFKEPVIPFGEIANYNGSDIKSEISLEIWRNRQEGDKGFEEHMFRVSGKGSRFNIKYLFANEICPTVPAKDHTLIHFDRPKYIGTSELCLVSTFPEDYNFVGQPPHYLCGMSVPPVMVAQIASRVHEQWLSKI
jgi:DNA (cytosine-5)-methyltransferase 1